MTVAAAAFWLAPNQHAAIDRVLDKLGGAFHFDGESWQGRCPDCGGPSFKVILSGATLDFACLNPPNYCSEADVRRKRSIALDELMLPDAAQQFSKNGHKPVKQPLIVRWYDEIEEREIDWLWQGWLAMGALSCIGGDPGIGKTYILNTLAAAISKGWALPGGQPRAPGKVMFFSDEDSPEFLTKKRLRLLGADPKFVADVARSGGFMLDDEGIADMRAMIAEHRPTVVTLDPVMSYLGEATDTKTDNAVRAKLRRLREIAEEFHVCIIYLLHLNKSSTQAILYRFMGSMAFVGQARTTILVGADKDLKRRAIFMAKTNLGIHPEPVGFEINETGLVWLPSTSLTKDEVLQQSPGSTEQAEEQAERKTLIDQCADTIIKLLKSKPKCAMPGKVLSAELLEAGFSKATIDRARFKTLPRPRRVDGSDGRFYWEVYLPEQGEAAPDEEHIDFTPEEE